MICMSLSGGDKIRGGGQGHDHVDIITEGTTCVKKCRNQDPEKSIELRIKSRKGQCAVCTLGKTPWHPVPQDL